ncbi:MAG: Gfo/Idh/MocA family oxidoreductase [Eubacteriales bacterium]|nr:Gfo/Idh/MocA family oxidoreductase [Eubacteriales bacterium]
MDKLRLGIIGFGNMGSCHYHNIISGKCPDIEVTAITETNTARMEWMRAQSDIPDTVKLFDDIVSMLDSKLIDAAIIAVPHYYHPVLAVECMKRGIHVMVEKPAGVYTKQVREMNEFAKSSGVVFGMMFNQRTNHIYRKLRELVRSGEYGRIRRTNWIITDWYRSQAYYDSGLWRATWAGEGGGVLLNQCPHQLDLWQWICGMPSRIEAHLSFGKWHSIEVEDEVTSYAEYANGATGVFITSTGDACGTNRFEIQTDKAKFVIENGELNGWELFPSEPEFSKSNKSIFGLPEIRKMEINTDGQYPGHPGVLNAFAGAILRGEPLVAGGEEGINGLTLSNAMHLSCWLGKPVDIPFDEDLYYNELMKRVSQSKANKKTGTTAKPSFTTEDFSKTF